NDLLFHGRTGRVILQDGVEFTPQLRYRVQVGLAAPAGSADALTGNNVVGVLVREFLEVLLALADGLGVTTQDRADVLQAAVAQLGDLRRSVATAVVLAQRPIQGFHGLLNVGGIGEGDSHGISPPQA